MTLTIEEQREWVVGNCIKWMTANNEVDIEGSLALPDDELELMCDVVRDIGVQLVLANALLEAVIAGEDLLHAKLRLGCSD